MVLALTLIGIFFAAPVLAGRLLSLSSHPDDVDA